MIILLELIEAQSINSNYRTLRDEGMGIGFLNNLEDALRLIPPCQHKQHLHLLAGIEALAVDDRASPLGILVDEPSDLLMLL